MLPPRPIKDEVKLTFEDIEQSEELKNLPEEKKLELISFVYDLSLALYHHYSRGNDKR
jgi:hypothetical protein